MPEERPDPLAPRPVIPIDPPPREGELELEPPAPAAAAPVTVAAVAPAPAVQPVPVMPISEPGVVAPAPFAQIYSAPPASAAPAPPPYSPPAYPPPAAAPPAWPGDAMPYRSAGAGGFQRPGIVTALGVISIIVAAISVIGSLFSGCTGLVVMASAKRTAMVARTTVTPTPMPSVAVNAAPPQNGGAGPNGLAAADRTIVERALRSRHVRALTAPRQKQLDAFLAEHGSRILAQPGGATLTPKTVIDHVANTGQEFSSPGTAGPDFFVFKAGPACPTPGRLRIYDDRATFRPDDHTPDLRSTWKDAETVDAAPPPPTTPPLEDDEARAVVGTVLKLSNNRVNAAQVQTLTSLIQSQAVGNWLTSSSTIPGLTAQVKSAAVQSDNSVTITFVMGRLVLDAQGNMTGPPPAIGPVVAAPGGGGIPTTNPFAAGFIGVEAGSCGLVIAEAVLSALLAVYLLVVGILNLRPTGAPRALLLIYAALKILCGVAAIVGLSWMIRSMNAAYDPTGTTQQMMTGFKGMAGTALTFASIGLIFPIAVLLVLTLSRTAREYYRTAG